ncbi:alpha/beta hydrolase family protein [Paracidovorax sp. MALMAid1276]|uniref:alpha/beta hydrolase family protein n=1 Tax=Paracidovorax sp. MALMAid1276 TaxID=3411631 RepID=UPI003B9B41A4
MRCTSLRFTRLLAACLAGSFVALVATTPAHAGLGLAVLPGPPGDGPVTVFYPTPKADRPVQRGPFTVLMAPQAPPAPGNGRLVVVSHGSGGNPWTHTDLARALVRAGFVVAMPEHQGDNVRNAADAGPVSWKRRPAEVSRAIDAVAAAPQFAPLLQLDRVGVAGQSAGGHTALSLAGGVWSPARFLAHCQAHIAEDFNACVGTYTLLTGGLLDGVKKAVALGALRQRFDDAEPVRHHDRRIAVAVAGVPAAADFDLESLRTPRIPLGLVTAGRDVWLTPRWHGEAVAAACTPCTRIAHLPEAGHSVLLSPPPPPQVLGTTVRHLLADPEGFDRAVLPALDERIVAFLSRHLLQAPVQAAAH